MYSWSVVASTPHPLLRHAVIGDYVAWEEHRDTPIVRRETPSLLVPCIITFGAPYELRDANARHTTVNGGFVAGPYDCWVDVGMPTHSVALQVNFTLLAARRLFGFPLHELTNAVVDLPAALGRAGRQLVQDLGSAPDWPTRFRLLDAVLVDRWQRSTRTPAAMQWAWTELGLPAQCASAESSAALHHVQPLQRARAVQDVARALGWSNKRLGAMVQDYTGLTPRRLVSVHRVERATHELRAQPEASLSVVAAAVGYADHAHLTRDLVAFTGLTPSRYRRYVQPEMLSVDLPLD